MAWMVGAARAAATAINIAMAATGILGIIALIVSAGIALWKWIFPATDEALKQAKAIEDLTDRYKTLTEELQRGASGREMLLQGYEVIASESAALQSADISKVIDDLNKFQRMDKDTPGYEEAGKQLKGTLNVLEGINPEFGILNKAMDQGKTVGKKLGAELKKTANEIIEMGVALNKLPDLLKAADMAMQNLGKNALRVTPLSEFIGAQEKAIKGLQTKMEADVLGAGKQAKVSTEAQILWEKQQENLDEHFDKKWQQNLKNMKKRGPLGLEARAKKFEVAGIEDLEQDPRWRSIQEVADLEKNIASIFGVEGSIAVTRKATDKRQKLSLIHI